MLHNYLLKTKQLLFLFCTSLLLFSACSPDIEIPQLELTVEDRRNIADRILNLITNNDAYEILDQDEYADAYEHLDSYINLITNSALLTHRNDYDWSIHIIDNDDGTNAFTTPGGYIYFDTGLLKSINSEATFMHFLANEIAYADKGFVSKKLQDNFGLQLLLDLALDSTVETAEELLNTLYNQPFDQNSAKEADDFMLDLACEKGYDAASLHWFLRNHNITWIDTHPNGDLDTRLGAINAYECTSLDSMPMDTYEAFLTKL